MKSIQFALGSFAGLLLLASTSRAAVGPVCDVNPPTSTDACIAAIQKSGGVVNDIFRDSKGLTALQLPIFGKLYNPYPSCDAANCTSCDPGYDDMPYDCPGEYHCATGTRDPAGLALFNDVASAVAKLDHVWGHACRLSQHTLVNGCPQFGTCVTDGVPGDYVPWEGFVFDLGGASNQVAIFAMNDHGPQPCESLEYTVFLTDNPQSQQIVMSPQTTGADATKWNRAVLSKVFTQGWFTTRMPDPTGHATCGDTAQYSVEGDAFVQVFKLPCGANFHYAAIVAGNDGNDFPECAYDSEEAELDAVAGLTEQGAGVASCPPGHHCDPVNPCAGDGGGFTAPDGGDDGGLGVGGGDDGGGVGGGGDATVGDGGGSGSGDQAPGSSSGCGCGVLGPRGGEGTVTIALAGLLGIAMRRRFNARGRFAARRGPRRRADGRGRPPVRPG